MKTQLDENIFKLDFYLFVKVHEKNNLVLNGGEEVVPVDELVNVLVPQSQVDFQSSIVPLVVRVSANATIANELPLFFIPCSSCKNYGAFFSVELTVQLGW